MGERERDRERGKKTRQAGERQTGENVEQAHIPQVIATAAMGKILSFAFTEEDKKYLKTKNPDVGLGSIPVCTENWSLLLSDMDFSYSAVPIKS